jgi:hypothetical protein
MRMIRTGRWLIFSQSGNISDPSADTEDTVPRVPGVPGVPEGAPMRAEECQLYSHCKEKMFHIEIKVNRALLTVCTNPCSNRTACDLGDVRMFWCNSGPNDVPTNPQELELSSARSA